jgi:hypothetical protein
MESPYAAAQGRPLPRATRPTANSIGTSHPSRARSMDHAVQQQGTGKRIPAEWPPSSYPLAERRRGHAVSAALVWCRDSDTTPFRDAPLYLHCSRSWVTFAGTVP